MSDEGRAPDDEPLTDFDVDVDTSQLGSAVATLPGAPPSFDPEATSPSSPADSEPQTLEPPRKMGVMRLRAPTLMGVAPPSAGASAPPATEKDEIPKIHVDGPPEEETTTLVGKMLAEAAAQTRGRLAAQAAGGDTYQDETATSVGGAERLIAAANEAFANAGADDEPLEEPTQQRPQGVPLRDAPVEDTTARRDAIDVNAALARAEALKAQLKAEAEAKKKKNAKKRTMVGLGAGPLVLPADMPSAIEGEIETLTGGPSVSAASTEPITSPAPLESPVKIPPPPPRRDTTAAMPEPPVPPSVRAMPLPTPAPMPASMGGIPAGTPPPGGVAAPPYAMPPMMQPMMHPMGAPPSTRSSEAMAFAQTQQALFPPPAAEPPKKKSRAAVVFVLFVLLGGVAAAAWIERDRVLAEWARLTSPPPSPTSAPADAPSASAAPVAEPLPPASAAPAPPASVEPAPPASASASASASAAASAKPPPKKKPKWRPRPKARPRPKPRPSPTSEHGF